MMLLPMADPRALPILSLLETRVLGALVEKEATVPDTYPLSLNALTAACNQKTSRDPVISASDADVSEVVDVLKRQSWIIESSGSRTMRYSHNVKRMLNLPGASVALLATLMLRGPQTAAEIRMNAERLHRFADVSAVEAFLDELSQRADGALVCALARQPGTREVRWMHLLSGPVASAATAGHDTGMGSAASAGGVAFAQPSMSAPAHAGETDLRITELQDEVERLRKALTRVCAELGIEGP